MIFLVLVLGFFSISIFIFKDCKLLLVVVLQDYKMSQVQVPAEIFPTKVFCCPPLAVYINEIFNANIREYSRILYIQQNAG